MKIESYSLENLNALFSHEPSSLFAQHDTIRMQGLTGSSDALLICDLFSRTNHSIFVFVANSKTAQSLQRECSSFLGDDVVSLFPSRDAIPYTMKSPFGPTVETRYRALNQLLSGKKNLFLTPAATLLEKIQPPKDLFNKTIRLSINDTITLDELSSWLIENGFTRETLVQDIGTFAIRGGICDIYPFLAENPVRLEFWGDTIESIREFDVFKQVSRKPLTSVDIFPMSEFCLNERDIDQALETMEAHCVENDLNEMDFDKLKHRWKVQGDCDGIEWFLHWFSRPKASILDYLPSQCMIIWDDMLPVEQRLKEAYHNYETHLNRVPEIYAPFVSPPDKLLNPIAEISEDLLTYSRLFINTSLQNEVEPPIQFHLKDQPLFNSSMSLFKKNLVELEKEGYSITLLCGNIGHAERLLELLENEFPTISLALGYIEKGFIDPEQKIALYSENQLFSRTVPSVKQRKFKKGMPLGGFDSLNPDDHVVHIDHGIAQFKRIERIKTENIYQDCMVLEYQDRSRLYVPVEDFHKVQKYIGKDDGAPTLSKLGTNRWEKQKARTRQSIREMAKNLIALYAKRTYLPGLQFPKDTTWQQEFEDAFIFNETPDQLSAMKEVKKDMESDKPMDRLVCGDVGFGKTEVAMRAAFKAVMGGYQVALLAPTTILAAQHYATFRERMANFPVSIGVLSRFVRPKDQKEIINKVSAGSIDILIGTHRILSKDITFKNLGLLIVDEEQRFGVKSKERLKEYRYKVDVLSMTATPIPRTMHMSLVGIRDLSIISTPPRNRLPIETHVYEYHEEVVKTAVENELERGGQVFIVHNRIKDLTLLMDSVERAVPQARVIMAHGQMGERDLELIMREFIAGKYDVLLSTTIIENGLDISNVNTIIVNRADTFGLSQLYQLRGRVGRSSEQAFAYFLTPAFKQIRELSLKRLRTLEQYTELGSGFQIAMRDLEIRGAGNILGTNQHGFIAAVGFELYCKLLKEEIDVVMGTEREEAVKEIKIDIPISAYLPADYIADSATRISLYQECSACKEPSDIEELKKRLIDRFGPLPEPAESLMMLMLIKIMGQKIGLSHMHINGDNWLCLSFHGTQDSFDGEIKKLFSKTKRSFEVVYGDPIILKTLLGLGTAAEKMVEIRDLFRQTSSSD